MQGNIYREVFLTFLAKKSYGWWITRRIMEIYTKISKRKDLVWSRQNRGDFAPCMGWCEIGRCCANFAQPEGVVRISHNLKVLCEFQGVVRISHKPGAVFFRRPYLPHFSSKSYKV